VSAVRPEFGPTLPELVGPRLAKLPPVLRVAVLALVAAVVLVVALRLTGVTAPQPDRFPIVVTSGPVPFNLAPDGRLRRVAPGPGELLRLEGSAARMTVRPLRLPPYRGDANGTLPVLVEGLVGSMARSYDDFVRRYPEGRANVNRQTGYQLHFQFRRDGRLWYGRRVLLVTTPTSRDGADIILEERRSAAVPRAESVGNVGALKRGLRSFRFGAQRP
jgi:hypothetical protein